MTTPPRSGPPYVWTFPDGRRMRLITLVEFRRLPRGTRLIGVWGQDITVGPDTDGVEVGVIPESELPGGYIAAGLPLR